MAEIVLSLPLNNFNTRAKATIRLFYTTDINFPNWLLRLNFKWLQI